MDGICAFKDMYNMLCWYLCVLHMSSICLLQALVWDNQLTGPFGLIAEYSLLKVM